MKNHLSRFARIYKTTALVAFNTFVLFVLVNVLIAGLWGLQRTLFGRGGLRQVERKYGRQAVLDAYENKKPEEIRKLLDETWSRRLAFEPYTHFKEGPFQGEFVRVHESGFRLTTNPGPWPPATDAPAVFLFGGSTTFGYGVADGETLGTALQALLSKKAGQPVWVYNFGRGFYFSTQERILFEQLLASDVVPRVAIFVDGLNEFFVQGAGPHFAAEMSREFRAHWSTRLSRTMQALPAFSALAAMKRRGGPAELDASVEFESVCRRYLRNQQLIQAAAKAFEVKTLFVWQPIPFYRYDSRFHLFKSSEAEHFRAGPGYEYFASFIKTNAPSAPLVWCADMQGNLEEPLYIDAVHYSPKMNRLLAEQIAANVDSSWFERTPRK
ncbi:MAG: SGNH/GDSL hydrolase family protein [Verrucomicrobiota bacterium]